MSYKLMYFATRGRAEQVRLLLNELDAPYEDIHLKSKKDVLAEGPKLLAFGAVPMLEDGDFRLVQGPIICSYLARKHGLVPDDLQTAAYIDQALQLIAARWVCDRNFPNRIARIEFVGADTPVIESTHDDLTGNPRGRVATQGQRWNALLDSPELFSILCREASKAAIDASKHDDARTHGRRRQHFTTDRTAPTLLTRYGVKQHELTVGGTESEHACAVTGSCRQSGIGTHGPHGAAGVGAEGFNSTIVGARINIGAVGRGRESKPQALGRTTDLGTPDAPNIEFGIEIDELSGRLDDIVTTTKQAAAAETHGASDEQQ